MLDQRWDNIGQTLGRCVVFAGLSLRGIHVSLRNRRNDIDRRHTMSLLAIKIRYDRLQAED